MPDYPEKIYIIKRTRRLYYECGGSCGIIYWKGLSDITRRLIYKYCMCPKCNKYINKDFSSCCKMKKSDYDEGPYFYHNDWSWERGVPYIISKNRPKEMESYLWKDKRRRYEREKAIRRKMREQEAGKLYTKREMDSLWKIQEGRCYYCGVTLKSTREKNTFSWDHIEPLFRGGTNNIINIALTCWHCNSKKHTKNETQFWKVLAKEAGTVGEWDFSKIKGISIGKSKGIWEELKDRSFIVQYENGYQIWESKAVITEKAVPAKINRLLKFKNVSATQHEEIKKIIKTAYYRKCKVAEQKGIAKSIRKGKRELFRKM